MQVTLRQAHKIVEKLNALLGEVSLEGTISLSVWDVPESEQELADKLSTERHKLGVQMTRQATIAAVRHDVRIRIGLANRVAVDGLIADRKLAMDVAAQIRGIAALARSHALLSPAAVVAQAKANRSAGATAYGSSQIAVSLLSADDLAQTAKSIKEAQLNIEALEEKLTAANSDRSNLITLPADYVSFLKEEGIVA